MQVLVDDESAFIDDYTYKQKVFALGAMHGQEIKKRYSKMRKTLDLDEYVRDVKGETITWRYAPSPFESDDYKPSPRDPVLERMEEAMEMARIKRRAEAELTAMSKSMADTSSAMAGLADRARTFKKTLEEAKKMDTPTPVKVKKEYQKTYDQRTSVENYDRIVKALSEVNHMAVLVSDNVNVCSVGIRNGAVKLEADVAYRLGPIKMSGIKGNLHVQVYELDGTELPLVALFDALDAFEGWGAFMFEELENTGLFNSYRELQAHCHLVAAEGSALLSALAEDITEGIGAALAYKAEMQANEEKQQLEQQAHYGTL